MSNKKSEKKIVNLKKAIAITTKALSKDENIKVVFSNDNSLPFKREINLSPITKKLSKNEILVKRGFGDSIALEKKLTDKKIFQKYEPKGGLALEIYKKMEKTRCELIGEEYLPGTATNINARISDDIQRGDFENKYNENEIPLSLATSLMLREMHSRLSLPNNAKKIVDVWRDFINTQAIDNFVNLKENLSDQSQFAKISREIIKKLGHGNQLGEDPDNDNNDDDNEDPNDNDNQENQENSNDNEEVDKSLTEENGNDETSDEVDKKESSEDIENEESNEKIEQGEFENNDTSKINDTAFSDADPNYKIFSKKFDQEINAEKLADQIELNRLREFLDQQLDQTRGLVSRLAHKMQRKLQAQKNRSWMFDLEEGILDSGRLTRVIINPTSPLSFKKESDIEFKDTVVSLLIDNSGSMRGRPISIAAICADILAQTLERCDVKCEVLGFTTRTWKGGQSRELWLENEKPSDPGRLNDLRHIIYKSADLPWRRCKLNLGLMMKEGLLKENIDGEALEWAFKRLLKRDEQRKILMVISDGAPVDDSTLSVNSSNFLEKHLRNVINMIENNKNVELIAIGIGHDVTKYYRKAITITDAEQLAGAITEQLVELFEQKSIKKNYLKKT